MKKRFFAIALCAVMIFALAACGDTAASSPTQTPAENNTETAVPAESAAPAESTAPKELSVAMTTSMADIGPFAYSALGRNNLRYGIYEYLACFSEFGQPWQEMEWQIAKDIQQLDDTTYQIEIYDYIVDAIGNPVTASDVAFCITQNATSGAYPRIATYFDSVDIINDYTIQLNLKSTVVGALEYIFVNSPIVSEKTYNENESIMSTTPIGTGPYRVTECVDGSSYVLTKNENYWQKPELANYYAKQPVDTIKYYVITEGSQATIALQTGEVDIISSVKNNELIYFLNSDGSNIDGFNTSSTVASTPVVLAFNMAEGEAGGLFRDNLPLRQAICTAINQQDVINIAYRGYAEQLHDISFSACTDYNVKWDEEDYYDYDLDKAKELLVEAGYADGKKDGQQVTMTILVSSAYSSAAQVVQSEIMELGFNVELLTLDDAMFAEAMKAQSGQYQWDFAIFKQGTEGYISNIYDNIMLRNKNGVGAKNNIVDDKLEELLQAAHTVSTHSEESVDALRYYVKDNAIAYGLLVEYNFSVGREGIIPGLYPWGYSCAHISTFN